MIKNPALVKNEIVTWIRDWFEVNGKDCNAVIGISGGKDSSIVAALCVQALGKNRVFGVLMPNGKQADIDCSKKLVEHLGIQNFTVNIAEAMCGLLGAFPFTWGKDVEINTPARIRMTTLYAVAATVNGRVACTCNKSEDWVGYSTKYGDNAGDFSPIGELTVTEVKQIGYELGLPQDLIEKTPIDGLCGKTDEDNLGFTYAVLDSYIRDNVCDDPKIKAKIDRMNCLNLHKLHVMDSFHFNPYSRQ